MRSPLPLLCIALSAAALVLSIVALGVSPEGVRDRNPEPSTVSEGEVAGLAVEIARLEEELAGLRQRLHSLELDQVSSKGATDPVTHQGLEPRVAALEATLEKSVARRGALPIDERDLERTRLALEKIENENTDAELARWVEGARDRMERVLLKTSKELSLDSQREEELRRVVQESNGAQIALLDELHGDPPPTQEDRRVIIDEIKQIQGERNRILGEFLTADELRTFQGIEKVDAGIPIDG